MSKTEQSNNKDPKEDGTANEPSVVIVREVNLLNLQMTLGEYFSKGYSISGGITQIDIGITPRYCVIVTKPF